MRTAKKIGYVAIVALIAACVTTPVSDKSAFIIIPESQEITMGLQAFNEVKQKEKESQDQRLVNIVQRVGSRIAAVSDMPDLEWEYKLFESEQQNAFALPGGKTAVYTGLLPVCQNEAGLAAVMGHEVAHVIARHGAQRISSQLVVTTGLSVAAISLANKDSRALILGGLGLGAMYGITLPFGRGNESEADHIGLIYMARAGYDPREAERFWSRFSNAKAGKKVPEFLSTHPSDETRIANIRKLLPRAMAEYEAAQPKFGLGAQFYEGGAPASNNEG